MKRGKLAYAGQVSPKLRSLLDTAEYRRVIDLLLRLQSAGVLESFLRDAEDYWTTLDIFRLVAEEEEGSGRGVVNTIRRDWERIWPSNLEAERKDAFALLSLFWKRLEQSRLFDDVMQDVLPDMRRRTLDSEASADQQRLAAMDDDERRDEMLRRLQSSGIVRQYGRLSTDDQDVQALAPILAPTIGAFVAALERKSATRTETLGGITDLAVVGAVVLSTLCILAFVGVVKLPFGEDDALPPASQPTVVFPSS